MLYIQLNGRKSLSNDKKKDSVFIANVINDLLKPFPEAEEFPVLCFKSENCSGQYCCRYVFPFYLNLAKRLSKPVLIYYGVNLELQWNS